MKNKKSLLPRSLKMTLTVTSMLFMLFFFIACNSSQKNNSSENATSEENASSAENLQPSDWKLGMQIWTFHKNTFAEALDKTDSCDVKYIEAFPPQEIGGGISGTMDYHMDADKRQEVKDLLQQHDIEMISYGVVSPKDSADWVQLFDFAKAMGLKNITSEPEEEQIPLVAKLADKYEINVAIHNHARPTSYWSPEIVLDAIDGAGDHFGACADVGHWLESDLDPIDCLKKLKGHIIEFHIKDENMKGGGDDAHDVPMGQGVIDIPGIMKEMKKQGFKGYFFIEHEYHFKNNVPEVQEGVKYFREQKKKIFQ